MDSLVDESQVVQGSTEMLSRSTRGWRDDQTSMPYRRDDGQGMQRALALIKRGLRVHMEGGEAITLGKKPTDL